MTDDQIHNAIRQHALCSLVHARSNSMASVLALSQALAELRKAEMALKAREEAR